MYIGHGGQGRKTADTMCETNHSLITELAASHLRDLGDARLTLDKTSVINAARLQRVVRLQCSCENVCNIYRATNIQTLS